MSRRAGETAMDWIARELAEHAVKAKAEAEAPLLEFCEWIEAHPGATAQERETARIEIRAKYPSAVAFDQKSAAWEKWLDEHPGASFEEKDSAHHDVWGFWLDPDDEDAA